MKNNFYVFTCRTTMIVKWMIRMRMSWPFWSLMSDAGRRPSSLSGGCPFPRPPHPSRPPLPRHHCDSRRLQEGWEGTSEEAGWWQEMKTLIPNAGVSGYLILTALGSFAMYFFLFFSPFENLFLKLPNRYFTRQVIHGPKLSNDNWFY